MNVILRGRSSSLSVTLSVEPLASTLLSSPLESFSPTFVTVTVPSWFTVKVISVTLRYPVGAASSWNVYVPGSKSNSLVFPASDVQLCTGLPSAVSPLKILILASAISVPPKFTLLKVIFFVLERSLSILDFASYSFIRSKISWINFNLGSQFIISYRSFNLTNRIIVT